MNAYDAFILGIVEGITEFLPISSTAHLEFSRILLGIASSPFVKSFEIAIQSGAIFAVLIFYFRKIFSSPRYILNICIAFVPTGVIGFLLYKAVKGFLLGNPSVAAWALLVGGMLMLAFERRQKAHPAEEGRSRPKSVEALSWKELLSLGMIQSLAVVPGVSRSGAVIIGGRMLGIPATLIAEFSFVLAIPTMLAATSYDLLKSGFAFSSTDWTVLFIGAGTAFVVAIICIAWLMRYLERHTFEAFGWYRIAVGIAALAWLLI